MSGVFQVRQCRWFVIPLRVPGRSQDRMERVRGTWRTGWSPTLSRSWTCRPSCPRGPGYSPPGRAQDRCHRRALLALAATGMTGLRPVVDDEQLAVLRVLADHRRSWARITPG
jgi:hypothetical protein